MSAFAVADVIDWAARYFEAWRSNDHAMVESLFAENAMYFYGPFREPARGRDEILRRWIENGAPANFSAQHEVIAVNGDMAVIHWRVNADDTTMDGVLIVRFDERGQCREHREWYATES